MTRRDQPISVDREVHHDFKAYCAFKRGYMIDLANKALVKEMISNGYITILNPEEYGVNEDLNEKECLQGGGSSND